MTHPLGTEYDALIYLNNSQFIGVNIKPFTYRIGIAPQFIPRIAASDPRGTDRARYKSWIQSRFDGGAGQLMWSSSNPTNRFAHSHLIVVGDAFATQKDDIGIVTGTPTNLFLTEDLDDNVLGDVSVASLPQNTTGFQSRLATFFTAQDPVRVVEFSGRPMIWHGLTALQYTSVMNTSAWVGGVLGSSGTENKLTGKWAVMWTTGAPSYLYDLVKFSTVLVAACSFTGGMLVYGSQHTAGQTPSTWYVPQYATASQALAIYDNKLWRGSGGQISYLNPTVGPTTLTGSLTTIQPAVWANHIPVGDASEYVSKLIEFNGKLYIGRRDGLWVYDGGTVYIVERYADESDPSNFMGMKVHRGSLYFNIRANLYRLTSGGLLEQIATPMKKGAIIDLESFNGKLYILWRDSWSVANAQSLSIFDKFNTIWEWSRRGERPPHLSEVWVYDDQQRSMIRWFATDRVAHPSSNFDPSSIRVVNGMLMIAPMTMSSAFTSTHNETPIVMADAGWGTRRGKLIPEYAPNSAEIITSMLDMGYPNLKKLFNSLIVDYTLYDPSHTKNRIDVSYLPAIAPRAKIEKVYTLALNGVSSAYDDRTDTYDGDWNSREIIEFGAPGASGSAPEEALLIGMSELVDHIFIITTSNVGDQTFSLGDYKNYEYGWRTGLMGREGGVAGGALKACYDKAVQADSTFLGIFPEQSYDYLLWRFKLDTSNFDEAYKMTAVEAASVLGYDPVIADSTTRYWMYLRPTLDPGFPHTDVVGIQEVLTGDFEPFLNLKTVRWISLGSIGGPTDFQQTRKRMFFPTNFNSEQVMFRFSFISQRINRPELRRYEVEYVEFPGSARQADFTAVVASPMILNNFREEVASNTIMTGLFSVVLSGITHVVALPWPVLPSFATIRARITIPQQGIFVPYLTHDTEIGGVLPGAEVPLHLEEFENEQDTDQLASQEN